MSMMTQMPKLLRYSALWGMVYCDADTKDMGNGIGMDDEAGIGMDSEAGIRMDSETGHGMDGSLGLLGDKKRLRREPFLRRWCRHLCFLWLSAYFFSLISTSRKKIMPVGWVIAFFTYLAWPKRVLAWEIGNTPISSVMMASAFW